MSFSAFLTKMEAAEVRPAAIAAFERSYKLLVSGEINLISESSIQPVTSLPSYEQALELDTERAAPLGETVVIKLNGGLGTSMGLKKAKSLLEVKNGFNFLDLIARQILHLRQESGAKVRFLLMNSFSTSKDTRDALEKYRELLGAPEELEFIQNQIPKIDAKTLSPATLAEDPAQEWCPPGHGDLYPALLGSGWLERLLDEGVRYAFVSNSDNLGATLDPALLSWFAESGAPFAMEVTSRTGADRKGGHLARRLSDERLILREVAQCPEADLGAFQDIERHRYFNTNNLWIRLDAIQEALKDSGGVLSLPVIENRKTINPRDKSSAAVLQLEAAMGAAIECFEGARAIEVPRSRFAPVKTTSDLLSLRSDAYEIRKDGSVGLVGSRQGTPPIVELSEEYKLVDSLNTLGVPSLVEAESLTVKGPIQFTPGATIKGCVKINNTSNTPQKISAKVYQDEEVTP